MGLWASRPAGPQAVLLHDDRLVGSEKYLGGVLGDDGNVYAIPGHARQVLKIVPASGTLELIGPEIVGKFKWLRGVRCGGVVYGVPCHAERVLKIVPATGEVTLIGPAFEGEWKWHGAVVADDGNVYAIPQTAERVLKICPRTEEVTLVGPSFPGRNKWYGGLKSASGAIFGIPANATGVLKIVPACAVHGVDGGSDAEDEVSVVGDFPEGGYKWHGGVVAPNDTIWGVPAHSDTVLRIRPSAAGARGEDDISCVEGPVYTGRHRSDGKYKYLGAVVGGDGNVYCIPSDADHVLRIDTCTGELHAIGESLENEKFVQNKWQNGFLGRDGAIYGIPLKAETILRVVPATGEVRTIQPCGPLRGFNKWEGGVQAGDDLYCMPLKCRAVLVIKPGPELPVSQAPDLPKVGHTPRRRMGSGSFDQQLDPGSSGNP